MMTDTEKDRARVQELVEASQNGSSEAFGSLYDRFVNPIYRYLRYRVGTQEAEDLTELVFLKTWENIHTYRARQGTFSSWIFRIAHNVAIDFYREQHNSAELFENIRDSRREAQASDYANRTMDHDLLDRAMKELKDPYRQMIVLKYMNDLTNEEIGQILSKSQPALRILQFRALKKLRLILENMGVSDLDES